jgi:hypothetical protein
MLVCSEKRWTAAAGAVWAEAAGAQTRKLTASATGRAAGKRRCMPMGELLSWMICLDGCPDLCKRRARKNLFKFNELKNQWLKLPSD